MNKKIFYTILLALGIVLLMGLLWWFFSSHQPSIPSSGNFGTAQNKNGSGQTTGTENTNIANTFSKEQFRITPSDSLPNATVGTLHAGQYNLTQKADGTYVISPTDSSTGVSAGTYRLDALNSSATAPTAGVYSITPGPNNSYIIVAQTPSSGTVATNTAGSSTPTSTADVGQITVPDVSWFYGSTTLGINGGTRAPGTVFNPKAINQINSSNPSGGVMPNIGGGNLNGGGGSGIGLGGLLIGAGIAGGLACSGLIPLLLTTLGIETAQSTPVTASAIALDANPLFVKVSAPSTDLILGSISLSASKQTATQNTNQTKDFFSCVARTIARAAIQAITVSVVNWINSGFKGSPSFVTNPTAFFANVADQAAGQFIRGSALSFLCSPFSLQVRVAIAQSYANRYAQSCSLTKVVNNVKGFMNGNFAAGGWPGLISFTSSPTNNPYGAYMYGQAGLQSSIDLALRTQQGDLLLGRGFLSFKSEANCGAPSETQSTAPGKISKPVPYSGGTPLYVTCDQITQTPGSVIAGAVDKTLGVGQDSLNLAKSFDEIISALIQQLMVQALQGGLLGLSGQNGYQSNYLTPDQQQAQAAAAALLTTMQADSSVAQTYGGVEQGSIGDVQNTQAQLNNLANCWAGYASSTLPADKMAIAAANASSTYAQVTALNTQVDALNGEITRANTAIATLEQLMSRALSAASTAETTSISTAYNAAKSSGQILSQADVVTAQQNRTTLQAQLGAINQQTGTKLTQCYAFGN